MAKLNSSDGFVTTIHTRINSYFQENNISTKADYKMKIKLLTGLISWMLTYIIIYVFASTEGEFFFLYMIHGMAHIYFSFNVGHDALHNAISKTRIVNNLWAYSYDLLGVNTYMWRFMHHRGHHACLNVYGEDMSLETANFLRLSNKQEKKWFHKYQHWYVLIIYGLYLFYYVFVKDYKYLFSKNNVYLKETRHQVKEWVKLLLGKFTYLFYMLILPILYFPFKWSFILGTFVIVLFFIGLVMSLTFQTTHIIDSTSYPQNKGEYDNYIYHVFATTADFSTNNSVINWLLGGLNLHVIHHLRSDICHTHYPALTKIVKQTANEFGILYRANRTFGSAILSHLKELRNLGQD